MERKKRKKKLIIGLVEKVKIKGKKGTVEKRALFDTGATRTSVDIAVAAKAGIGPIFKTVRVKSASHPKGYKRRPVAKATIIVKKRKIRIGVSLEDRHGLPFPILIGRDIIHNNFIIDVEKTHSSPKAQDEKDSGKKAKPRKKKAKSKTKKKAVRKKRK